jgi:hypothetical protein
MKDQEYYDKLIRDGLNSLPQPLVSSDFNRRVLKATAPKKTFLESIREYVAPTAIAAGFAILTAVVISLISANINPIAITRGDFNKPVVPISRNTLQGGESGDAVFNKGVDMLERFTTATSGGAASSDEDSLRSRSSR